MGLVEDAEKRRQPEMVTVRLGDDATGRGRRKRRSRWGDEKEKVEIPGLPTELPPNLSPEQIKQYLRVLRIEELSRLLRKEDLKAPENERSPSPQQGVSEGRVNSRDVRYRNKLEEERHRLVEEAMREDPTYRPPTGQSLSFSILLN
jgi:splicing factor 1